MTATATWECWDGDSRDIAKLQQVVVILRRADFQGILSIEKYLLYLPTKTKIMATPIKAVPILTGELADEFVRRAEEQERQPRHELSHEDERRIAEVMRRSREFVPSWMRK